MIRPTFKGTIWFLAKGTLRLCDRVPVKGYFRVHRVPETGTSGFYSRVPFSRQILVTKASSK